MRDCQGSIVYAYTIPLGIGTNSQAEIQAAFYGMHWFIQHGYKKIMLEVDSELFTKLLKPNSNPMENA